MKKVTIVDEHDNIIGSATKEDALKTGKIRRISRINVFNSGGELLIQKRSDKLMNMPGRWDNSAAGHVDEGETYLEAAVRELREEIGLKGFKLTEVGKFYVDYIGKDGKAKRGFNMLYRTNYSGVIEFDKTEVSEIRWIVSDELKDWMSKKPNEFTAGFLKSIDFL